MDRTRLSIGIDVGSRWLDVATWLRTETARFTNTTTAHRELLAWLAGQVVQGVACEASAVMSAASPKPWPPPATASVSCPPGRSASSPAPADTSPRPIGSIPA